MNKTKITTAIDIGSSKITTLIAQIGQENVTNETTINIVGVSAVDSKGVKKGQIVDIEETINAVTESVEAAERMAGYSVTNAYITVGGAHVSSQNSTGVVAVSDPEGEINQSDVERVIDAARAISIPTSREIIHVLPRQFMVDGETGVKDPVGMSGVRLEVDTHIVTASASALKNLVKTIQEVGIQIEDTVFSGLASSFSTLSKTEKELGCVLVDIGAGVTSIAVFVDGSLSYSSAIPIGARNVTNDLAIGLRVSLEKAENIKRDLSKKSEKTFIEVKDEETGEIKKIQKRTLVEGIIRPRLNEIFTMIKIDLEKAGLIHKIPSGVVVTGGGAETIGVSETAKKILSLQVRIASPKGVTGLIDDIMYPSFSAPIGLILYSSTQQSSVSSRGNILPKNVKLPNVGIFTKMIKAAKDLLP